LKKSEGEYVIIGKSLGEYKIRGFLVENHRQIISNTLEIEVFNKLETNPVSILVAPECLTSIDLFGGPNVNDNRIVEFNYELQNSRLVIIEKLDNRLYQINAK